MNTILFDLDGTLLSFDQEIFVKNYMEAITEKLSPLGYPPKTLMKAIWTGTEAMVQNDGSMTNEKRFWQVFAGILGNEIIEKEPLFNEFYLNEFKNLGNDIIPNPLVAKCIRILKEKGYTIAAATNPLFPMAATLARMEWAGIEPDNFTLITSYEESSYCKPNLNYYREILEKLKKEPQECMMVGNDVSEDMCAAELGMDTFLLTSHVINKHNIDIAQFKNGNYTALYNHLNQLPKL